MIAQHVINLSGGKDSGGCAELALMRGKPFRSVMSDTGNENQITWDHVGVLDERLRASGLSKVETVRADFTARIANKRKVVETKWRAEGVPEAIIERALSALQPTGNPFLDLCIWKGRFPSKMAQFCTEFLKYEAIWQQVLEPALQACPVIQWIGVRRDESVARKDAPMWRTVRHKGLHRLMHFQPLIHWTGQNAIDFTRARGGPINPLYSHGMGRVGCFPCVNVNKKELAAISRRFPEAIERVDEWAEIVAAASKRGKATFFPGPMTPQGAALAREERRVKELGLPTPNFTYPNAKECAEWSKTDRGGRQTNWLRETEAEDEGLSCSSQYGLCE